jgi:hypothetical protein
MFYGAVTALALAGATPGQFIFEPDCPPPVILLPIAPCPAPSAAPAPAPSPAPQVREVRTPNHIARKPVGDEVLRWNNVMLEAIKAEKTSPPMAARNMAIVHAAIYDAVNGITQRSQPYAFIATGPAGTSPEAAAAVAAHRTLVDLFPKQAERFDKLLEESLSAVPPGPGRDAGITLGKAVAEKTLAWRTPDREAERGKYTMDGGVGRWKPTAPKFAEPLLPGWGALPCFAMRGSAQFRPAGPPALNSEAFLNSFQQVKALGGVDSKVRTPEQTEIARFWEDGVGTVTPPGHWNRIAQDVAVRRGQSLAENARMFAMLNVALADAAVSCWDSKFHFDLWRPITAIREADRLKNAAFVADPKWTPLLATPPFPSYTSGHSTFSSAGATVLGIVVGDDRFRFSTTSDDLPGVTRSFERFSEAAKEAGMSRIYGGIHWDFDNRDGLISGEGVARHVAQNYFKMKAEAGAPVAAAR